MPDQVFLHLCNHNHVLNGISDLVLTENTEMKLKELLSGLSTLPLSDAEAVSVMLLLRQKSPNVLDAWQKVRYHSYSKCLCQLHISLFTSDRLIIGYIPFFNVRLTFSLQPALTQLPRNVNDC